ncbi:hypothetical protein NFI96_006067 [Prochilodus magdalenae]|nr:hypothetical protein NFI96_006067 [Prochilodus magdalenae]
MLLGACLILSGHNRLEVLTYVTPAQISESYTATPRLITAANYPRPVDRQCWQILVQCRHLVAVSFHQELADPSVQRPEKAADYNFRTPTFLPGDPLNDVDSSVDFVESSPFLPGFWRTTGKVLELASELSCPPLICHAKCPQVPQGRVVSLSFRVLDLESDTLCRYDYVDVYDGHVNGQRLGRFCGTSRPGALVTSGNKMQVVMVSDANTAGSGFLAAYTAVWPNQGGDRYCGGLLDKPGTLKTPNWPDRDYPAGVTCSWHIVAPQHHIIELKFEKFDLERDSHCRYDHMAAYNGGELNEARRIGRFCGDSPPAPIYSDDNQLFIQFVSDLSLTADGFIGHYLFRSKNSTIIETPLTAAPTVPTTTRPTVITGTLISAAMREQSVLATFSITSLYKEGNLAVQQAGKTMSTKIIVLCKKCPLVRRDHKRI